jgi:hypothetical protein
MIEVHTFKTRNKDWERQREEEFDPLFDAKDKNKTDIWEEYLNNIGMM